MLDYETMSPPYGECIVVNPAVASAADSVVVSPVSASSSVKLFETPRCCLEKNSNAALLIDTSHNNVIVVADNDTTLLMNGSISKGPGGTGKGHHHYSLGERKCGKWSKPSKCRGGGGDDEQVDEILAETLANMRLKEKSVDEKKKSQMNVLPQQAAGTTATTTMCKISRSPPSKVEESKNIVENKIAGNEEQQKSKDNCDSAFYEEVSAPQNSCGSLKAKPDNENIRQDENPAQESVKPEVTTLKTYVSKSEEKLSVNSKIDNNATANTGPQRRCLSDEDSKKKHVVGTATVAPATTPSLSSPTSTSSGSKRLFVKPKDIINSTRQKSLILAHKSKTASAPPIPQHVVTRDLLGADLRKCRDNKNVDELAKALSEQLNVVGKTPSSSAATSTPCEQDASSTILVEGQRIQRSPIPVPQANRRAAVAPYNVQMVPNHRTQGHQCSNFSAPYGSCSQQPLDVCYENQSAPIYYDQQQAQSQHQQQQQQYQNYPYNSISNSSSYVQVCTVYSASPQYEDICSPPFWSPGSGEESPYSCLPSVEQPSTGTSPNCAGFRSTTNFQPPCAYSSCTVSSEPVDGWSRRSSDTARDFVALQQDDLSPSACLPTDFNGNEINVPFERSVPVVRDAVPPPVPTSNATSPEIRKTDLFVVSDELPEPLTDFILDYSWKEGTTNGASKVNDARNDFNKVVEIRLAQCISPCTATTASAGSPAASKQALVAESPENNKDVPCTVQNHPETKVPSAGSSAVLADQTPPENTRRKSAKQQLREMIKNDEFNKAWIWALRCSQASPGALFYRDADGDSFLHIVVWQKDMAKIYSLTELMKTNDAHQVKPFDLRNKLNETPLFLAVEKRLKQVVAYGLENCSNPNIQAYNRDQDTPLHYAAARGMTDIVQILCESPLIDINVLNGSGLSPLMSGVKSHRNTDEENQSLIDNKSVVGALLKCGADAKLHDSKTGKTLFHYAIECMDPQMMRLFREHLDKELLHTLANKRCYAGQTPLELLSMTEVTRGFDYVSSEEGQMIRIEMGRLLAELGADLPRITAGSGTESPDFYYSYDASCFP